MMKIFQVNGYTTGSKTTFQGYTKYLHKNYSGSLTLENNNYGSYRSKTGSFTFPNCAIDNLLSYDEPYSILSHPDIDIEAKSQIELLEKEILQLKCLRA